MSTLGPDPARPRVVLAPEIAELTGSVAARLPALVDRVIEHLLAEIEFYRDRDVVSLEDLRGSVRNNLESMVGQLTTNLPPDLSAPRVTGRRARPPGHAAGGHPSCVPDRLRRVVGSNRR